MGATRCAVPWNSVHSVCVCHATALSVHVLPPLTLLIYHVSPATCCSCCDDGCCLRWVPAYGVTSALSTLFYSPPAVACRCSGLVVCGVAFCVSRGFIAPTLFVLHLRVLSRYGCVLRVSAAVDAFCVLIAAFPDAWVTSLLGFVSRCSFTVR